MVVYWICPWGEWQNADSWPSSTIVPAEIQEGKHMHLKTWTQKGHALCDFSSSLDNFSYIQNSSVSALSQDRGRENRAASECRAECRNSEHLLAFLIPADPWLVVTSSITKFSWPVECHKTDFRKHSFFHDEKIVTYLMTVWLPAYRPSLKKISMCSSVRCLVITLLSPTALLCLLPSRLKAALTWELSLGLQNQHEESLALEETHLVQKSSSPLHKPSHKHKTRPLDAELSC